MNKNDLIASVSSSAGLSKSDATRSIESLLDTITNALKRGERVELRDIFTIEPRIQKSSFRRNPKNGVTFFAKEKKKILFKISKSWTKKINEKE